MKTELRTRSCTTLGEIVRLHNCAVASKGSIDEHYRELSKGLRKSHTTLGEILGLHNCAVADITPQLRASAKRKDGEHDDHL